MITESLSPKSPHSGRFIWKMTFHMTNATNHVVAPTADFTTLDRILFWPGNDSEMKASWKEEGQSDSGERIALTCHLERGDE